MNNQSYAITAAEAAKSTGNTIQGYLSDIIGNLTSVTGLQDGTLNAIRGSVPEATNELNAPPQSVFEQLQAVHRLSCEALDQAQDIRNRVS
jgi:hypothetical protein